MRFFCLFLLLTLAAAYPGRCQDSPVEVSAPNKSLYQQALDTYLNGDYDQAILLAAQSVEADPQDQKSRDLLTLLTKEKKEIGASEIWLPSQAVKHSGLMVNPVPALPAPVRSKAVRRQIEKIQQRFNDFYVNQAQENGLFQGQILAVSELLRENANHQYDELRKSQNDLIQQIQAMNVSNTRSLWILYVLCFVSMLLSLSTFWALSRRVKRRT
ncbi:MAG: hypothetical protein ACREL1_02290 [bacterium]